MLKFYMRGPAGGCPPVPAGGLYYYILEGETLLPHLIDLAGVPQRVGEPLPKALLPAKETLALPAIPSVNWMLKVPGAQASYLAMAPIDRDQPTAILRDALDPIAVGGYVLPPHLRASLVYMLHTRRNLGYVRVSKSIKELKEQDFRRNEGLVDNALPFWLTVLDVSEQLVTRISTGIRTTTPSPATSFVNPDLVFQLNRVLSEGFIEGYAKEALLKSGGYALRASSIDAWGHAIDRARCKGITYASIEAPERQIFGLLWKSVFHLDMPELFEESGLFPHFVSLATPGKGAGQNIVFWSMHYPHWFEDLVYALRELDRQGICLHPTDVEIIARIITNSLLKTKDQPAVQIAGLAQNMIGNPFTESVIQFLVQQAKEG